jgi:hypothetical protein
MKKMTRQEINQRLEKLRQSRLHDESYAINMPIFAMCYPPVFNTIYTIELKCGQ